MLPDKSFTDASVFFSAVAVAASIDFTTMIPVAERAVGELVTFFQYLLDDNARNHISDVHLLCIRNDSIRDFLQTWLAPYLPNTSQHFSSDISPQAVYKTNNDKATSKPTTLETPPTFLSMDIRLSRSQPCDFLKLRGGYQRRCFYGTFP